MWIEYAAYPNCILQQMDMDMINAARFLNKNILKNNEEAENRFKE
jgi:hypothetical protein